MAQARDPLSTLSLNHPRVASSSSSSSSPSTKPRPLAPIFHFRKPSHASPSASSSSLAPSPSCRRHMHGSARSASGPARKRVKMDIRPDTPPLASDNDDDLEDMNVDEEDDESFPTYSNTLGGPQYRAQRLTDWFCPVKPDAYESSMKESARRPQVADIPGDEDTGVWVRSRRRTGRAAFRHRSSACYEPPECLDMPYLDTFVHSTDLFNPLAAPTALLLPSLHPPNGRPRDSSPALAVAFNRIAKYYDAPAAQHAGQRRLMAVASDEGGLRVVDVDEPVGLHREHKGYWWRGHANTVYDIKWSADGTKLLTASGDFTSRIHSVDSAEPTCVAVLKGHTSCVKSATFFDPSRSMTDPSALAQSSIIASGGRDGNILIFDIRCKGRGAGGDSSAGSGSESDGSARSGRSRRGAQRYSDAVPGFTPGEPGAEIHPVMVIRQPHGDGTRRPAAARTVAQSVTSLIALQAMPGILASGGAADGAVKLWDIRFPDATKRSPDPRPICSAWSRLDDPTIQGNGASRRPRSINSLAESPATGDIYALCADSKIHVLRPSAPSSHASDDPFSTGTHDVAGSIVSGTYTDSKLFARGFYFKIAISPDGKYLASASGRGGMMTWDLARTEGKGSAKATRFPIAAPPPADAQAGMYREKELSAIDWGKDMVAACSDDHKTRIWRADVETARMLRASDTHGAAADHWVGAAADQAL